MSESPEQAGQRIAFKYGRNDDQAAALAREIRDAIHQHSNRELERARVAEAEIDKLRQCTAEPASSTKLSAWDVERNAWVEVDSVELLQNMRESAEDNEL